MSESTTSPRQTWNEQVIAQFHAGEARLGGVFDRSAVILLSTIGARSGRTRVSPLAFYDQGERLVVVASAGGSDKHPDWYFNILANPHVTVERWVDGILEHVEAKATSAEGAEREQLFAEVSAAMPGFADYQTRTSRVIPVICLDPV